MRQTDAMLQMKTFYLLSYILLATFTFGLFADESAASKYFSQAEKELFLAEAAYGRVQIRFDELQNDPEATTEQVLAMESYMNEMKELVALRRQTLADLEAIAAGEAVEGDPVLEAGMRDFESAVSKVPDTTAAETEAEKLEREFAASLEAFDGMILAHNQKLEAQMDARLAKGQAQAGAQQTAAQEAEALLRSMGVDPGTGTAQETAESGKSVTQSAGSETAAGGAVTENTGRESAGSVQPGAGGGGGRGSNREPRRDEDIVARQLREAAEKETDPVLREKLWKEYEAYLDGQQ